ncbi:MAG TPA: glycosyltransferase [Bryobacteraceae bacterium]|jgi:glycosyltransferase involved in cell wall biosynthesis
MNRIAVMHVLDALRVGGAERVAVNLANLLPGAGYETFLCTTREEGPFASLLAPEVGRLSLTRRGLLDLSALRRLSRFIGEHDIRLLHAHGSALFFARLATLFPPHPALIWHDHYGRYTFNDRPAWLYRAATRRVGGVIAVNHPLAEWSRRTLGIPAGRVWYIPNLVEMPAGGRSAVELPGVPGSRIVCVANIRPQKDHPTLLAAMTLLKTQAPQAHLLLVGDFADAAYKDSILRQIGELGLAASVSYLGRRNDVAAIIEGCDIAVLSSRSEGLPLALLEYGMSGLPAIATNVGQCPEVLAEGAAGILVPPGSPAELAAALLSLLGSPERRATLGKKLRERVTAHYGAERIVAQVAEVYGQVLSKRAGPLVSLRPMVDRPDIAP